ncbi:isoprenylcysteine carboxylmethyltransferase family protein [soil metagenome]
MRRLAPTPRARARLYLAAQAAAGALWWVAVFASGDVRRWTLGSWDPAVLVGPDLVLFVGGSALAAALGNRVIALTTATWTMGVTLALLAQGMTERTAGPGVVLMVVAAGGSVAAAATLWSGRLPTGWFFVGPFAFSVAAEAPGARHLRRSLAQLVVFWTVFFVVVPMVLAAAEERLRLDWPALQDGRWDRVGIVAFALASALGLWSCVTMSLVGRGTPLPAATARDLVVAGPYRCVRNPMAVAGAVQTAGIGLWRGSWTVIAVAAAGAVAWDVLIRPEEEADLAARFGPPYQRYAAAVRCWLPSRPWRDRAPGAS